MSNQNFPFRCVSFVGPDGAGKTKRAEWLADEIEAIYIGSIKKGSISSSKLAELRNPTPENIVNRYLTYMNLNDEMEHIIYQTLMTNNVIEDRHSLDTHISNIALLKHFYGETDSMNLKNLFSKFIPTAEQSAYNIIHNVDDNKKLKIVYVTGSFETLDGRLENRKTKGKARHIHEAPVFLKCYLDEYNRFFSNIDQPHVMSIDTTDILKNEKEKTYGKILEFAFPEKISVEKR